MVARSALAIGTKNHDARVRSVFSVIAAGLLAVSLSTPLFVQSVTATMPDLTGYNVVEALEILTELELDKDRITVNSVQDEFIWTPEMWRVCSQSVEPESVVSVSTRILLRVSLECQ